MQKRIESVQKMSLQLQSVVSGASSIITDVGSTNGGGCDIAFLDGGDWDVVSTIDGDSLDASRKTITCGGGGGNGSRALGLRRRS